MSSGGGSGGHGAPREMVHHTSSNGRHGSRRTHHDDRQQASGSSAGYHRSSTKSPSRQGSGHGYGDYQQQQRGGGQQSQQQQQQVYYDKSGQPYQQHAPAQQRGSAPRYQTPTAPSTGQFRSGHIEVDTLYGTGGGAGQLTVNSMNAPNNSTMQCGCENIDCPFCNLMMSVQMKDSQY